MKTDTRLTHLGRNPSAQHDAVNPPVVHASTIVFPSLADLDQREKEAGKKRTYGLHTTPTTASLEEAVAALEGGHDARLFPSGLAAIVGALLAFLKAGDHLLMVDSVYGPTRRLCDGLLARLGVETTYYDPLIGGDIARLIRPNTSVIYVESPGSITFEVQDVPAIAEAAHQAGSVVVMDNAWATPLFFKPFEHGVDVSVQPVTKYIGGHGDVLIGLVTATEEAWPAVLEASRDLGQSAGPDDCYLALRGMRTMGVRLARHQASGLKLARWLADRPEVETVLHPALPGCPGHEIWQRDFTGASGLFSFVLKPCSEESLAAMLDGLGLFSLGFSWGGYESLIMTYQPDRKRKDWAFEGPIVRVHAGLEDPDDLIADLDRGLARLRG